MHVTFFSRRQAATQKAAHAATVRYEVSTVRRLPQIGYRTVITMRQVKNSVVVRSRRHIRKPPIVCLAIGVPSPELQLSSRFAQPQQSFFQELRTPNVLEKQSILATKTSNINNTHDPQFARKKICCSFFHCNYSTTQNNVRCCFCCCCNSIRLHCDYYHKHCRYHFCSHLSSTAE